MTRNPRNEFSSDTKEFSDDAKAAIAAARARMTSGDPPVAPQAEEQKPTPATPPLSEEVNTFTEAALRRMDAYLAERFGDIH